MQGGAPATSSSGAAQEPAAVLGGAPASAATMDGQASLAREALPTTTASPAGAGTSAPARVAPKELTFDTPFENLCPSHAKYVKSTQWTLASSGGAWVLDDASCLFDFKPEPVEPPQFGRRGARTSGAKASTAQPPSSSSAPVAPPAPPNKQYTAALRKLLHTPVAPKHPPLAPSRAPLAHSGGLFPKQAKASPSVPVPPGGET